MSEHVVLLSIPGLRSQDLASMPALRSLAAAGEARPIAPSFPCVTCPVQANMTTGKLPRDHGVIANGFYWREKREVEMWTAWNRDAVRSPQIWDVLHRHRPGITSAAWFPLNIKGAGADYICTPAPIHNPDGSESLWCYTKPSQLYGELRDRLGHFPLHHFWGPLAGIPSSRWIAESAAIAWEKFHPNFFYIYLPHLDYAAQKHGPDSPEAQRALGDLDGVIEKLIADSQGSPPYEAGAGVGSARETTLVWLVVSEYVITPVSGAVFPNRLLREAGLLKVRHDGQGRELIDFEASRALALADHQLAHVFVNGADAGAVAGLFRSSPGVAEVLAGAERAKYAIDHERSGEVVLISAPDRWFAYYWWLDDAAAPALARTVDIHRKPGYDPVELFFEPATKSIPLKAELVKGSHGFPALEAERQGVILASRRGVLPAGGRPLSDVDVAAIVLSQWGLAADGRHP